MDLWQQYELEFWWWRHRIILSPRLPVSKICPKKSSSKIFENGPPKSDLIWSQFRWIKLIKSSISTTQLLARISSCKQLISEQYRLFHQENCEIKLLKLLFTNDRKSLQAAGWPSCYIKILKSTVLSKSGVKMWFLGLVPYFQMIRTLRHPLPLSSP